MDGQGIGQQLCEVEAVRQARLEAQQWRFQLEQSRNELVLKSAELEQLRQAAEQAALPAAAAIAQAQEAMELARLESESYKYKLATTELELARQLDALRELQWRLDSVVAQLGLQQQQQQQQPAQEQHSGGEDAMALICKVGELAAAQAQAEEYRQQLAACRAELGQSRQACASLQRQLLAASAAQPPVAYTLEGMRHVQQCHGAGRADAPGGGSAPEAALGQQQPAVHVQQGSETGRQLVETLLRENDELRGRLAQAEDRSQAAEQELEAELLAKAQLRASVAQPPPVSDPSSNNARQAPVARLSSSTQDAPSSKASRLSAAESSEVQARRRLEARLEEKDRSLGRLRELVKELERKLVEAFKRQANLASMESTWREHEGADRRLAEMSEERAALLARLEAAQAEAEAARREAAAQRRLAKRVLQRPAVAGAEGGEADKQMVELLQRRVKILEAQAIKLRLSRRASSLDSSSGTASAEPSSQRPSGVSSVEPSASSLEGEGAAVGEGGRGGWASGTAGENRQPNAAAAVAAPRVRNSLLEGNPVLEKWEADKRLQKKIEVLEGKLKEKASQLTSCQAAKEQLARQVQELQQAQAASRRQSRQGGQGSYTAESGRMVPAAKVKELLQQLDDVQRRHDALERQVAALQHRVPPSAQPSVEGSGPAPAPGSSSSMDGSTAADASGSGRPYSAANYGGGEGPAAPAQQGTLEMQVMEREARLFDLALERDQAAAAAARLQARLDSLFEHLGAAGQQGNSTAAVAAGSRRGSAVGSRQPTAREQELLDTVALLKSALERTRKGLESGVSNSKYMQVVDKVKQLKARLAELEAGGEEQGKYKEELSKAQQQLGQLRGVNNALRSQLKAAQQRAEGAVAAREEAANAQIVQLERALQERDLQLAQAQSRWAEYGEEVRVLIEEGLHPAALVQELLSLRPRLRELEEQNSELRQELAALDAQLLQDLGQLKAEHELLHTQSRTYEAAIRDMCSRTGEPLPLCLG